MIYCGVDGGGTKTKIIIADDDKVIAELTTGPTAIDTVSLEEAKTTILYGLDDIYENHDIPKIDSIFLGIGGISSVDDSLVFNDLIKGFPYLSKNVIIGSDNDIKNAYLASCNGRNNITIIVGTGAVAYGVDEVGVSHRTNGIHFLEGDYGSAYDIGIRALKKMSQAFDGRIEHSSLTKELLDRLDIKTASNLSNFFTKYRLNRTYIAQLAKTVTKYAEDKDPNAMDILDSAIEEMVKSIIGVDKKIDLKNKEIGVVGSLGKTSEYFDRLKDQVREYDNRFIIHTSELDPVHGSLIEAKNQAK